MRVVLNKLVEGKTINGRQIKVRQFLPNEDLNQCGAMPIKLPASDHHIRNFLDAIKHGTQPICDIETAVHSDTLCRLALIAVKQGRKLEWNPEAERFTKDEAANAMLQPRPFRGDWKLPEVG